jgi:hypothetical protein
MAFDGNGNFVRVHNWTQDAANGVDITASEMDAEDNGFAGGLTNCVTRDGQGKPSADLTPSVDNNFNLGTASRRWATLNGVPVANLPVTQANIGLIFQPQSAAELAAMVTPTNYFYQYGDARRYGGDPTGATVSDAAWIAAVAQASQSGGAEITGPGTYLMSTGFIISTNGVKLRTSGMGPTTFKANANNIILVKVAASFCDIGSFACNANGHTGVEGLVLAPANEALTGVTSQINFNRFGSVYCLNGLQNGVRLRAGPSVSGVDSGVFYNVFEAVWAIDCIRGIWMQDAINAGAGGPNRNTFMGVRCGGTALNLINTGIQIDCGSTNHFFATDMEGIANGVTPNTTPTAFQVKNLSAISANNSDNHFFSSVCEANTRDVDNTCSSTCFFGGSISSTKIASGIVISTITNAVLVATVTTATPHGLQSGQRVRMIGQTPAAYSGNFAITVTGASTFTYSMLSNPGGNASVVGGWDVPPRISLGMDPSQMPTLIPGMQYGEGVSGFPSGYWGMLKEIADFNLNWQPYPLTTGLMTNVASILGGSQSQYRQLSNMVSWHAVFQFDASVAATNVTITPPVVPNAALYSTVAATNAFYSFYVEDGSGVRKPVEGGWTSTGKLYIKAPSTTWNTSGNNNVIFIAIDYHI